MSIAAPPHVSLAEWETTWSQDEDAYELVAGVPTMTPPEAVPNIEAASLLHERLAPIVRPGHRVLQNCGVHLRTADGRDTVRQPDLLVLPATAAFHGMSVAARDVTLAVEVISPSSIERDWVAKRTEYAAAGIPNYLIIDVRDTDPRGRGDVRGGDVRDGDEPRIWLFDTLVNGAYADPTGDGTQVTIRIPGHDPITITAADLLD